MDTLFWYIVGIGIVVYAIFMFTIMQFLMNKRNNNSCIVSFFVAFVFTLKVPICVYYILLLSNLEVMADATKNAITIVCIAIYILQVVQWLVSPLTSINSGVAIPILTTAALAAVSATFFVQSDLLEVLTGSALAFTIGALVLISVPLFAI